MSPCRPSTHTKRGVRMYSALAVECSRNIRMMDDDQPDCYYVSPPKLLKDNTFYFHRIVPGLRMVNV